jgi:hypothetical protein
VKNAGLLNSIVGHGTAIPTYSNAIWEHQPMSIYHIHHIVPRHMGGTDDPDNLTRITIEEHAEAHRILYEEHGKKEDYIAWKGLEHSIDIAELIQEKCSIGGKKGGTKQAELGLGFHTYKTNPELHKSWASKGGLTSGQFQKKDFQSEMGKRGGPRNKGFVWINDGEKDIKYTTTQQNDVPVDVLLKNNPQYKRGRILSEVTCPHCGKIGTSVAAMYRHHFDHCKKKEENICPK